MRAGEAHNMSAHESQICRMTLRYAVARSIPITWPLVRDSTPCIMHAVTMSASLVSCQSVVD
jgi:hypothetical protein